MKPRLPSVLSFHSLTIKGFTLIEVVLYVTLVTLLISALIPFSWNVIQSGVKASVEQDVTSQARYLSERIKYEIRNADAVNSVTATSLDLATATSPRTIIDLSGGKVRIRYGLTGTPIDLNSNATSVTSLLFTNRTSSDYKTQNIQYSFTISDTLTSARQEYSVPPTTIQGSVSVRTPILATPTPGGVPTATPVVPTNTPVPPTNTPVPPTPTAVPPSATPVGGWWAYRKQITIQDAQVTGTTNHTNFPVLINLSSDADLAARAQDDGDDIKFTASDGVTKLDHEIETFNGTTGQLVAWVQVPTLNATANTTIYLYYGNVVATNQQNQTGTWDSNYIGVWHLDETSGAHRDSTVNNLTSTTVNVTQQGANIGRMNGADEFNGIDDWVEFTDSPIYTSMSNLTVEAWAKTDILPNTKGEQEVIVAKPSNAFPWWSYSLYFDKEFGGNKMTFIWLNTSGEIFYSTTPSNSITTGVWYHLVGVKNGPTLQIYVNGSTSGTTSTTTTGTMFDSDLPLRFGAEWNCASFGCNLLDGMIDEVRISNIARSADWINTEYNNQNSPATFYTLGSQQTL